jgi:P27 family predicted phage terminase small subunit
MATGRKPKPYQLKLLEGNRGKRKLTKPPDPSGELGPPPSSLNTTGRQLWRLIVKWYGSIGIVKEADTKTVEIFCRAFSDYKKYTAEIKKYGAWYEMPTGSIRLHPRVIMRDRAVAVIHRFGSELGFTPVARQRLTSDTHEGESELEKILKGER